MEKSGLEGGKYIGQGAFGCAFSPALATKGEAPPRPKRWLGKVMTATNAKSEIAHMTALRRIDPRQSFGLYSVYSSPQHLASMSEVVTSAGGTKQLEHCKGVDGFDAQDFLGSKRKTLRQILLTNAVGGDMVKVTSSVITARQKWIAAQTGTVTAAAADVDDTFGLGQYGLLLLAHVTAMRPLFEGLAHYHSHGLIHTDIKPSNVVLADGTFKNPGAYKFIDFGLVERVKQGARRVPWMLGGTEVFMPLSLVVFFQGLDAAQTSQSALKRAKAAYRCEPDRLKDGALIETDTRDTTAKIFALAHSRYNAISAVSSPTPTGAAAMKKREPPLTHLQCQYVAEKEYADVFALLLTFLYIFARVGCVTFNTLNEPREYGETANGHASLVSRDWKAGIVGNSIFRAHERVGVLITRVLSGLVLDAQSLLSEYEGVLATLRIANGLSEEAANVGVVHDIDGDSDDSAGTASVDSVDSGKSMHSALLGTSMAGDPDLDEDLSGDAAAAHAEFLAKAHAAGLDKKRRRKEAKLGIAQNLLGSSLMFRPQSRRDASVPHHVPGKAIGMGVSALSNFVNQQQHNLKRSSKIQLTPRVPYALRSRSKSPARSLALALPAPSPPAHDLPIVPPSDLVLPVASSIRQQRVRSAQVPSLTYSTMSKSDLDFDVKISVRAVPKAAHGFSADSGSIPHFSHAKQSSRNGIDFDLEFHGSAPFAAVSVPNSKRGQKRLK